MKKINMIATDMDGTLLNEGRAISEENIQAIKQAQASGINVVVATGRDYTEAVTPLKEVGLRLPLLCVNGADLREEDGEVIHQQTLDTKQYKQIEQILKEEGIYYEIYTTKGAYTNDDQKGLDIVVDILLSTGEITSYDQAMQLAEKRFQEGAVNRATDYNALLEQPNIKLFKLLAFSEDEEKRVRATERMKNGLKVAVSASAKENLEITHQDATKGKGIEVMCSHFGIDISETMVLGDNFNDVPMMEVAGYSVAMGNAEEEVKKICDQVTKTNVENGVAHAIHSILPSGTK